MGDASEDIFLEMGCAEQASKVPRLGRQQLIITDVWELYIPELACMCVLINNGIIKGAQFEGIELSHEADHAVVKSWLDISIFKIVLGHLQDFINGEDCLLIVRAKSCEALGVSTSHES